MWHNTHFVNGIFRFHSIFGSVDGILFTDDETIIDVISGDADDIVDSNISKIKRANSMKNSNDNENHNSNNYKKSNSSQSNSNRKSVDDKINMSETNKDDDLYVNDDVPKTLPLRPIVRDSYNENNDGIADSPATVNNNNNDEDDRNVVYTEQHTEVKLNCDVDLDITAVVWMRNGQVSGKIVKNGTNE